MELYSRIVTNALSFEYGSFLKPDMALLETALLKGGSPYRPRSAVSGGIALKVAFVSDDEQRQTDFLDYIMRDRSRHRGNVEESSRVCASPVFTIEQTNGGT